MRIKYDDLSTKVFDGISGTILDMMEVYDDLDKYMRI